MPSCANVAANWQLATKVGQVSNLSAAVKTTYHKTESSAWDAFDVHADASGWRRERLRTADRPVTIPTLTDRLETCPTGLPRTLVARKTANQSSLLPFSIKLRRPADWPEIARSLISSSNG